MPPLQLLLSLCLGVGLSAASGLRVFLPLLLTGAAARTGHLTLAPGFQWLGSDAALLAFAVAAAVEIAAYHIPWLDHALDLIATPAAVLAGVVLTASVVTGLPPMVRWALAIIAGGGAAGALQLLTVGVRGTSGLTTGGLANPIVGFLEALGSLALSLLALAVPFLAVAVVAAVLFFAARRMARLGAGGVP